MSVKSFKINKSCSENWTEMQSENEGRFCNVCAKTVLDFTELESKEILNKINESKGNVCGRLTKSQLKKTYLDIKNQKHFKLPYSNAAAGLFLAATVVSTQSCDIKKTKDKTEIIITQNNSRTGNNIGSKETKRSKEKKTIAFSGKINRRDKSAIENVKITLITLGKLYVTYSKSDGTFSMKVPLEIIDDANVLRFEYDDIKRLVKEKQPFGDYFENEDRVYSQLDLKSKLNIIAKREQMIMGLVLYRANEEENEPIVISEGEEVSFKEFNKALSGEKSSCSIKNKDFLYLEPKAAIALYGEKARHGLYLFSNTFKQ